MSDTDSVPASRREVWLIIALAVARDELPAPDIRLSDRDYNGRPYVYVQLDRHDDARRWAYWLDCNLTDDLEYIERPDLGRKYVKVTIERAGWRMYVEGIEALEAPPPEMVASLAAEVAAAILTPDAEPVAVTDADLADTTRLDSEAILRRLDDLAAEPAHQLASGRLNEREETVLTCTCGRTFTRSTAEAAQRALDEHARQQAGRS
jgi:hypothetical protein